MPDSATGTTSDTGTYVLTNVLGDTNDLITMYISNGVTTGYVAKVKLTDALGQADGAYTVPKMTENLHSGDSLSVRLVDSEKLSSGDTEIEIVYPDVATGLSFYTSNFRCG